jgi:hypothetical protein
MWRGAGTLRSTSLGGATRLRPHHLPRQETAHQTPRHPALPTLGNPRFSTPASSETERRMACRRRQPCWLQLFSTRRGPIKGSVTDSSPRRTHLRPIRQLCRHDPRPRRASSRLSRSNGRTDDASSHDRVTRRVVHDDTERLGCRFVFVTAPRSRLRSRSEGEFQRMSEQFAGRRVGPAH